MTLEVLLAFIIANTILTLIPGPSVLLIISQSLTKGMPAALMCILGDLVGGALLMILSLLGVGAILAASATLFTIFKWLGVVYMAYLGYCQIIEARKSTSDEEISSRKLPSLGSFKAGFISSTLNPKAIAFYVAFLPQFMNPNGDMLLQFSILIITSTIVVGVLLSGYALLAFRARKFFQSKKSQKNFGYIGGSFLMGSSAYMATAVKS